MCRLVSVSMTSSFVATRGKALSLLNTHKQKVSREMFEASHAQNSSVPTMSSTQNTSMIAQPQTVSQQKKRRYAMTPAQMA